ncbi:MAG TPA: hypothetical protein VJT68_00895, partial [Thermoleophilaceae bacterium]|nr:hypothetical protein [Thermoleophilaceae bacterium]
LLVMTATWLRAAAGAEGLREVSRRVLQRIRGIPSAREASAVLDRIDSEGRLAEAARALTARLSDTPKRPRELLDAVLTWVAHESSAFEPARAPHTLPLAARALDLALIASACIPFLAIALG